MSLIVGPLSLFLLLGAAGLFLLGHKGATKLLMASLVLALVGSFIPNEAGFTLITGAARALGSVLVPVLLLAVLVRVLTSGRGRAERPTSKKRRVEAE